MICRVSIHLWFINGSLSNKYLLNNLRIFKHVKLFYGNGMNQSMYLKIASICNQHFMKRLHIKK